MGMLATKTISEGDTRAAGLRWIRKNGGVIFNATRRLEWPGSAAVVVSVLHIAKAKAITPVLLDGRSVPFISAFLFSLGGDDDPHPLQENQGICFNGCNLASQGFLFDDADPKASPLSTYEEILRANPESAERVFPYFGGDEINSSPLLQTSRKVIYFGTMSLADAERWPELLDVVRKRVKPSRDQANRSAHAKKWWLFGDPRPQLMDAVQGKKRFLVCVFVSKYLGFVWLPTRSIVSHNVGVFADDRDEFFAVLQSRVHQYFSTELSSGLEDRPGYRPTDGFLPFPFPPRWGDDKRLSLLGREFYRARSHEMRIRSEGLTQVYNRFHDPDERDPGILRLRELHDEMDRAVLAAYGWTDLQSHCDFLLDYDEEEDQPNEGGRSRGKKKPWRYRWPDGLRDEVLARLLELNRRRAVGLPDVDEPSDDVGEVQRTVRDRAQPA